MLGSPAAQIFAECEAIARERADATGSGAYADGYRCASKDIADAIHARGYGRPLTPLERDLRDAEVEARTLARVISAASAIVDDLEGNPGAVEGVRRLLSRFFAEADLPEGLRRRTSSTSSTSMRAAARRGSSHAV